MSWKQRDGQDHGRDSRNHVGFKKISGHTGTITNIVPDIVCDHGRVPGIVFWNTGFDLSNEVRANIGRLGENPTTNPGKYADQASTKG